MPSLSNLRRLALLLALLPQLLSLGLGRTLIFCVAPGGHSQLELAASLCCVGPESPDMTAAPVRPVVSSGQGDCSSCQDYGGIQDQRVSVRQHLDQLPLSPELLPASWPPGTSLTAPDDGNPSCRQLPDGGRTASHLSEQRSVVLHC